VAEGTNLSPASASGGRRYDLKIIAFAVGFFALAEFTRPLLFAFDAYKGFYDSLPEAVRWLEQPARWMLIVWLGLWLGLRLPWRKIPGELGLDRPIGPATAFAFLACSPMLLVPAVVGSLSDALDPLNLLFLAGIWPFAEEVLFRGYAFRQIHRRGGLGFWSAALFTGVVFGLVHLGNASVRGLPLAGEVGAVAIISIGGVLYAWLFVRWDDNLWVPFGVHLFMNLWWEVFDMSDNPLGGWLPNVLRLLTAILAVGLTLYRHRLPYFRGRTVPA
jgi:membrane protease YdiL (CAAX protease family)